MGRDLGALLSPRSVAVVGASPKPGSVAGEILRNLQRCSFPGSLYPVNPKYDDVDGVPCLPTIHELPECVDLAVLAINRDLVLDAVSDCAQKGIRNLVIITAGFKESGEAGIEREKALRSLIAKHGLNVVGPNCMGIISSSADVRLNASFSRWFPQKGEIAFVSQSGSLGETLLECFEDAGLGVSLFINLGNRAGLSENDFLEHLEGDNRCKAIFLYLESFADPGEFRKLVERISKKKPVVVLKAGRTEAGAAAVASHTGSLASSDVVVDAFLRQCGALRVATIQETLTALRGLERGVFPAGPRVAILTNAGGAGIIAADACERVGIDVPLLPGEVRERLSSFLPPEAGVGNPVDMIATAGAADYERSLDIVLDAADAAIVIFRPPLVLKDSPTSVAEGIVRVAARRNDKPVVVSTLSQTVDATVSLLREGLVPTYAMPETAVDALAVLHRARELRDRSQADDAGTAYDVPAAREIVGCALAEGRGGLYFHEGAQVLEAYGIRVCAHRAIDRVEEAMSAAEALGFPLVAKIDSPNLFHRFENGAVVTGIGDTAHLERTVARLLGIANDLGLTDARILLQQTVTGRELIFGVERDPAFGPVVMFGIGGTLVEALKDVAFAVAPVTQAQSEATIRSIRAFRLLEAFRGQASIDLDLLIHTLSALGQLALDVPQIAEIDLNPVIAEKASAAAVDILIKLNGAAG